MPALTIPQAFDLALQYQRAGRLAEAEVLYQQILVVQPIHAEAVHHLGVIALQAGRYDLAIPRIRRAIALEPSNPSAHSNLGEACRMAGSFEEAVAAFHRAIQLQPELAEAQHGLGKALMGQQKWDEALAAFRRAIEIRPDFEEAHNNLGFVFFKKAEFENAAAAYRSALSFQPNLPEAHHNLGLALIALRRHEEAMASFRRAVALKPDYPEAHNNLGNALVEAGHLDDAIRAYRRSIEINPGNAEVHNNIGHALSKKGHLAEGVAAYRRAIQLQPEYPDAYNNLGAALDSQGHIEEAIEACRRAIRSKPDSAAFQNNLGVALGHRGQSDSALNAYRRALQCNPDLYETHNNLGNMLRDRGQFAEAMAAYHQALELKPDFAEAHSNLLLALHYSPAVDAPAIFAEHRRWADWHARPLSNGITAHENSRVHNRRLRVGYVSPDFREHSAAFFLEGLFAHHDRAQVDVFCYADVKREDRLTDRFRRSASQWRNITGVGDERVVEMIRNDAIDVLVDVAGHTADNRLLVFARKPAPVQVTWLGYPDTTGLPTMDYRFTDAWADPPGTSEQLHAEELVRLPETAWCFQPSDQSQPPEPPPMLHTDYITFGSCNARSKMSAEVLNLWARLLSEVPGSRLLLKNFGFSDDAVREGALDLLANEGIRPERVELLGWVPSTEKHLAVYDRLDIALDTFPYCGTTTTCEALWMGVPVVTLAGRTHVSRVGVSLLTNVGLPELIAQSSEEYIRIATDLAKDVSRLAELRSSLRKRMTASPLMDARRFARNVEAEYREMWRRWCAAHPNPSIG